MNSVLKKYDNFSDEYFKDRANNNLRYDALFRNSEEYLEKIQNKLSNLDMWKDTVVLIISDHGCSIHIDFADATQSLETGGHVYPIAVNIVALDDYVAQIDADPEL